MAAASASCCEATVFGRRAPKRPVSRRPPRFTRQLMLFTGRPKKPSTVCRYPLRSTAAAEVVSTAASTGARLVLERYRQLPSDVVAEPWIEVLVRRKWNEAREIVCLELVGTDGAVLPRFEAGAYINVELPGGLIRPYSLANAPGERDSYLLAVLLEPGSSGGSIAIHNRVKAGDRLRVLAPRNTYPLQGGAIHSVLLAGGIGIAPLLSMAEYLWHTGASFDLHYSFRTPECAAFLRRLREAPFATRVHRWCSQSESTGRIDVASVLARVPRLSHLYLCGPATYTAAIERVASQMNWPSDHIHQESFEIVSRI